MAMERVSTGWRFFVPASAATRLLFCVVYLSSYARSLLFDPSQDNEHDAGVRRAEACRAM